MASAGDRSRSVPYPAVRRVLELSQQSAARVPMIHGFVEYDVTEARRRLKAHETHTGEKLSFTGWIVYCLAQAVAADRSVQALRRRARQLEIFDDVDVGVPIEREMGGEKQPIITVIRGADKKSFADIHRDIRAAQSGGIAQTWEAYARYRWMPVALIRLVWPLLWWRVRHDPSFQKASMGTVGVTAVGMFGTGGGWGLPVANRTQLTLGGIAEKPAVVGGRIEPRDMLSVTLSFDHAIIDGGNAARFANRLKTLVESAAGLEGIGGAELDDPAAEAE